MSCSSSTFHVRQMRHVRLVTKRKDASKHSSRNAFKRRGINNRQLPGFKCCNSYIRLLEDSSIVSDNLPAVRSTWQRQGRRGEGGKGGPSAFASSAPRGTGGDEGRSGPASPPPVGLRSRAESSVSVVRLVAGVSDVT